MTTVHFFLEVLVLGSCWPEKCAQLTLQLLNLVDHAPRRPAAASLPPSEVGSVTELHLDSSRLVGTLAMPLRLVNVCGNERRRRSCKEGKRPMGSEI